MGPAQVEKWFDYLEKPEITNWDGRLEIDLPEYPGVTFRWYPEKMEAVTENEITPLYTGMPIWNTYFCDLTGDGLPELCSTITFGSGIIDSRVIVYDYANGASYTPLEDVENMTTLSGWMDRTVACVSFKGRMTAVISLPSASCFSATAAYTYRLSKQTLKHTNSHR